MDSRPAMNELTLPKRFEKIIKTNQEIHGAIKTALHLFSQWLYTNQLVFFPEYTDHGVNHVQDVLNTADSILRDSSLDILTPEDIYVLTSSILLHDCAMHISKAGLKDLINKEIYSSSLFGYPIESSFKNEWLNFEREVSKYSDRDWHKFFSDESPVTFPDLDKDLTERQLVLIGEFVRKHHARMAQVIARHGLPTGKDPIIFFNEDLLHLNELSGFVARSHNISLRQAVELVRPEHARITKNTHLAFIMGLLRIADYLQFENKRTPKLCFNTRAFCSPISILEWKKQMAVLNTHHTHSDEELLYVDASPEDATTLEGVGRIIKGLQHELDALWAVLGEMYSRFSDKKDLGINIRRVRSSIDDPEDYIKRNYRKFHPTLVGLTTNDERLYPLLASPLYGDKPMIGLRELIQNSIDACNERFALESGKDPIHEEVPYGITVTLNQEERTLVIEDSGSGMDVSIIENYFLKIGSSFRYSASWQENYLKNDGAIVPRTGRFGVGVLAGFLLGDDITIHTRKINEPEDQALIFSITPSSQKIQINYEKKETYGTSIKIKLNNTSLKKFGILNEASSLKVNKAFGRQPTNREDTECRWYYLDTPTIELDIYKKDNELTSNKTLISKSDLNSKWNILPNPVNLKCFWRPQKSVSSVYCNGIVIPKTMAPGTSLRSLIFNTQTNAYEVFFLDNNAALPLNLQRNGFLNGEFPYANDLKSEILKNYISETINNLGKYTKKNQKIDKYFRNSAPTYRHKGSTLAILNGRAIPIYEGFEFNPNDYYLIDYVKDSIKRGLIHSKLESIQNLDFGYIYLNNVDKQSTDIKEAIDYFSGASITDYYDGALSKSDQKDIKFEGWHFIKKFDFNKLDDYDLERLKKRNFKFVDIDDEWISISKNANNKSIPSSLLSLFSTKTDFNCFMFSLVQIHQNHIHASEFHEHWKSLDLPNSIDISFFE